MNTLLNTTKDNTPTNSINEQLEEIRFACTEDNWNKLEYKAIREAQLDRAVLVKRFVEGQSLATPLLLPLKSGEIGYSWMLDNNSHLLLVILDNGLCKFTGVIDNEKIEGQAKILINELPGRIKRVLKNMYNTITVS